MSFILTLLVPSAFGNDIGYGRVLGEIKEKESGHAIEYATIRLYNSTDSIMMTGTVSRPDGSFVLEPISYGSYYLVISFMGYQSVETDEFNVSRENSIYDLGDIFLSSNATLLNEVEIVANHHNIDFQIDKKVISVNQQLASASQTAVEILESVPSIRVDIEGNVSLRGSSGITVLIDGKPTVLDASDVLSQIPASTIQNIEIITNPSAKYEPDGSGGIINVITKKSRTLGFQGILNASTNTFGMYRGDLLFNYNTGKVNYFISGQYGTRPRIGESINERRTTDNDTVTTVISEGAYERLGGRSEFKAGMDWNINPNNQFSLEFSTGRYQRKSISTLDYSTSRNIDIFDIEEISENESERAGNYSSITSNFRHIFNQENHTLNVQIDLQKRNGTEYAENFLYGQDRELNIGSKTTEDGPSDRLEIKIDYSLPITEKQKFEAGFQLRKSLSDEVTNFYLFDEEAGDFIVQDKFWNNTTYDRNIFSGYGIYQGEIKDFGYQLGLRSEYTFRNISTAADEKEFLIDRWDFFPTLHFSYNITDEDQLMASYSRRIDRPRGYFLEPFLTWSDLYNVRRGDPDIQPEFIDAFELGYLKEWDKSRFSIEGYYRIQYNKVERIQSVYDAGVLLTTFANVGTDYSLGIESMFNIAFFNWWDFTLMGNIFDYRIEGERENIPFEFSSFNWSARLDNTFKLNKMFRLQIHGQYNGPSITSQGKHFEYYELNAGLRADMLSNKLSAVIQVRDIFSTHRHRFESEGPGFYNYGERTTAGPIFSLSLSYRINNYLSKEKPGGNGNGGAEMGGDFE
jgi:outer membrane receptor protein involved in Fe transport